MTNSKTKRGAIRQLINRQSVYSLQDYSRKITKRIGRYVSKTDVRRALRHMETEGQLVAFIDNDNNDRVVGRLFNVA